MPIIMTKEGADLDTKGCGILHAMLGHEYCAGLLVLDVTAREFEAYCDAAQADPAKPEGTQLEGSFFVGPDAEQACRADAEAMRTVCDMASSLRALLVMFGMSEEDIDRAVAAKRAELEAARQPMQ